MPDYIAIDLKSFYASVECVERGLDPMTTNLVVADLSRTEKTICLAVSPSLKAYSISSRPRFFEVVQRINEVNALRRQNAPGKALRGSSYLDGALQQNPSLAVDFLVAPPQMAKYMEISAQIYGIYLKYIAEEDIHVYSIDEVLIDATSYRKTYGLTARDLASKLILEVLSATGITATAGIGTNLYLCKVAMDIGAKHRLPDKNGVRIAQLDEGAYRRFLWSHRPITDFWRVGEGYAKKLAEHGLFTMGDVARCSYYNEELLYRLFGTNAQLLIDHAWGWEPCTMADIKAYQPRTRSLSSGQVLQRPYSFEQAKLVVGEMADLLALELVDKGLVTNQLVLTLGYDADQFKDPYFQEQFSGPLETDCYRRKIPKRARATVNLTAYTSSSRQMMHSVTKLYEQIADKRLLIRRIHLSANHVLSEGAAGEKPGYEQLDFFTDYAALKLQQEKERRELEKEKKVQQTMLEVKKRYGKNAIFRGMNLQEGATAKERNNQIGGHKA